MAEWLKLRKSNCKNCYKCIRHCPVKSIRFSGNQAHIIGNECILCGQCFVVCPQNAKEIVSEIEKVKVMLQDTDPVIVSLAPSFISNYEVGIGAMRDALKKLGFYDAEETAIGATIVKNDYNRMLREEKREILISSCCHSVNLLIQKYFPNCLNYLADTLSPMQAHCQDIKRRYPNAKTVFVGPCLAKKDEADRYDGYVDAVLTFEELTQMLVEKGIDLVGDVDDTAESLARLFPTAGGVIKTMGEQVEGYTYMAIDGTENCIKALEGIEKGAISNVFLEMNACTGACISGPVMEKYHYSPVRKYKDVVQYAGKEDFAVEQPEREKLIKKMEPITLESVKPAEYEIVQILKNMGKTNPEDELNCGSCGYNTCREKAVAIFQGKADVSMCLPYLKEKAESFSDNVVNNTPYGTLVINDQLEVQLINRAAREILNVHSVGDVIGEPVIRIMDPTPFIQAKDTGRRKSRERVYLAEYDKYVERTIIPDREYHIVICMMRDVTEEEYNRREKEKISQETVEVADRVVEKQMRIVQDIASLLGETAAETKIALTKLRDMVSDE